MRQAIKQQDANARIWITYAKCAMATGDRIGTERGLEKAKEFGKNEFAALMSELQIWESALPPSANENMIAIKDIIKEVNNCNLNPKHVNM